jgi:ectoine hydroxylase-related dioxygenase (phytanoyl-CoA dioxygenase family)
LAKRYVEEGCVVLPGVVSEAERATIAAEIDRSLVGAWIAPDDATEANGCLRWVPGSHRIGQLWPTAPHGKPEEYYPTDQDSETQR